MDGRDWKGPGRGLTRRGVLIGSIGAGFALAAQPVVAQTMVVTPADGLEAGDISIKTATGEMPGYRAYPKTGTNLPTILVIEEVFGVHEYIKDVCRRFARLGYYAIAPELFFRQGDPTKAPDSQTLMQNIIFKKPDAEAMSDLDAAVAFAKGEGKASVVRLGVTGFCWGGRYVWLYAAHNPTLKAAVAWYGLLAGPPTNDLRPKNPVDIAADIKCPVLGLYGAQDKGITAAHIDMMKKELAAAGKTAEFVVYPDAGHAFHADYRPSYVKDAAEDGWKRCLAWFKAHGVA